MGFFGRIWTSMIGKSKNRIPHQMELLGAPSEMILKAKARKYDEGQEEIFIKFVEGKHGILVDWRANGLEIIKDFSEILTDEEKANLIINGPYSEDAETTLSLLRKSLSLSHRRLVRTESLGDFSFVILVPLAKEKDFLRIAGPWLI